ncbi:MAG: PEP-CTERM sorting domain-containing protein [Chitinophagaceae bacterium]|nr:PEP-CTERM sorting domain-containing protein [Rubrivivax sp.]
MIDNSFFADSGTYGITLTGATTVSTGVPTVPAVPEPSTYALLIAGGLLVGAAAKRRHAVSVAS